MDVPISYRFREDIVREPLNTDLRKETSNHRGIPSMKKKVPIQNWRRYSLNRRWMNHRNLPLIYIAYMPKTSMNVRFLTFRGRFSEREALKCLMNFEMNRIRVPILWIKVLQLNHQRRYSTYVKSDPRDTWISLHYTFTYTQASTTYLLLYAWVNTYLRIELSTDVR